MALCPVQLIVSSVDDVGKRRGCFISLNSSPGKRPESDSERFPLMKCDEGQSATFEYLFPIQKHSRVFQPTIHLINNNKDTEKQPLLIGSIVEREGDVIEVEILLWSVLWLGCRSGELNEMDGGAGADIMENNCRARVIGGDFHGPMAMWLLDRTRLARP